jgi:hypothetical protein
MIRFLKTLLLCLLLAALSFQGVAIAAQTSCGLAEHHALQRTATHAHQHENADKAGLHAGHHPDQDQGAKHKHSGCASCASCCAGATAPPLAFTPAPAQRVALPAVPAPSVFAASFLPAGLERPPKRVNA